MATPRTISPLAAKSIIATNAESIQVTDDVLLSVLSEAMGDALMIEDKGLREDDGSDPQEEANRLTRRARINQPTKKFLPTNPPPRGLLRQSTPPVNPMWIRAKFLRTTPRPNKFVSWARQTSFPSRWPAWAFRTTRRGCSIVLYKYAECLAFGRQGDGESPSWFTLGERIGYLEVFKLQ